MLKLDSIPFSGASDNYTAGRRGQQPGFIVVHVQDGSEQGTRAWFGNSKSDVSAHYGVSSSGQIECFVKPENTAWHSGSFGWNLKSLGIEHEGRPPGWVPTADQMAASVQLAALLCQRYGIVPSAATILPHCVINPLHDCPSRGFPLQTYIQRVIVALSELRGQPVTPPLVQTSHTAELLEYPLYDVTNAQIGTVSVVRGTDKCYLKTLSRAQFPQPGHPTAESYGSSRLFDPQTNAQIGTVSLVLSGARKAYLNAVAVPLQPR